MVTVLCGGPGAMVVAVDAVVEAVGAEVQMEEMRRNPLASGRCWSHVTTWRGGEGVQCAPSPAGGAADAKRALYVVVFD
uniref:Uncharacterized protein n=1 Tax=Knipowitschia caucasica TaxID=637954 RepID=A0AAV2L5B3_KNICA